ncbi:hypothetical protein BD779DRAFT_1132115 [Infundibulicybe gibba]|nr:hypothetical protein BD779DRAFT_1132115 [Infundibulicybe gibba]
MEVFDPRLYQIIPPGHPESRSSNLRDSFKLSGRVGPHRIPSTNTQISCNYTAILMVVRHTLAMAVLSGKLFNTSLAISIGLVFQKGRARRTFDKSTIYSYLVCGGTPARNTEPGGVSITVSVSFYYLRRGHHGRGRYNLYSNPQQNHSPPFPPFHILTSGNPPSRPRGNF